MKWLKVAKEKQKKFEQVLNVVASAGEEYVEIEGLPLLDTGMKDHTPLEVKVLPSWPEHDPVDITLGKAVEALYEHGFEFISMVSVPEDSEYVLTMKVKAEKLGLEDVVSIYKTLAELSHKNDQKVE